MYSRAAQKTIAEDVVCHGVGLHSGQPVCMTLRPADPDTGIYFVRTDCSPESSVIAAHWSSVVKTELCTVLGNEHNVQVGTVEHVMAALAGRGITNIILEIDGPELPALDGSAAPFVELIDEVGIVEQHGSVSTLEILEPMTIRQGRSWMTLSPAETFSMDFVFDFGMRSVALPSQKMCVTGDYTSIMAQVSHARTVGFIEEYEILKTRGFARGGSLENAVVYRADTVMNPEGLRYHDECVRHKILDAVGDLYLLGAPILGALKGYCSGHALNARLMRQIMDTPTAWRWTNTSAAPYAKTPINVNIASHTFHPHTHMAHPPVFCF